MKDIKIKKRKIYLCKCLIHDSYFISENTKHQMYSCPIKNCGSAVDIEDDYTRILPKAIIIRQLRIK